MIEFRILDTNTTPPGGWFWKEETSGMEFRHYSRDAFFAEIQAHRLANGYPIYPDWQFEIEDRMCKERAAEWGPGICVRVDNFGERKAISFAAMQSFFNTMSSWVIGMTTKGKPAFVDEEEARRRARICVTCPFNVPSIGKSCGSCADQIMRGLTRVIGKRSTSYDHNLGSCGICSCSLAAAIWLPLEAQQAGLNDQLRTEFRKVKFCWKASGL